MRSRYYANISLDDYPWYYGEMKRDTAQTLLKSLPHGAFLVRVSPTLTKKASSADGHESYVISLNYNSQIKHMRIYVSQDNELFLSPNRSFKNLVELVCWYQDNSLVESFHLLDARLEIPSKYLIKPPEQNEASYEYL